LRSALTAKTQANALAKGPRHHWNNRAFAVPWRNPVANTDIYRGLREADGEMTAKVK
jgi:hypothetical protein